MIPDIPWLKRFEEPQEQPDDDQLEQIDFRTMLEELEFR